MPPRGLQSETRRRESVDRALHDAETKLQELVHRNKAAVAAAAAAAQKSQAETKPAAAAVNANDDRIGDDASAVVVAELRGQVSRARERANILEERLDEAVRVNRRLERDVAEATELGVSEVTGVNGFGSSGAAAFASPPPSPKAGRKFLGRATMSFSLL